MATQDEHKLVVALEARVRNFERQMRRGQRAANQTVNRIDNRFAGMQRQLDRRFQAVGRSLAGALSVAALTQAGRAIRGVVAEVDSLAKAADRIGLSTTGLQQLRYGAELAGVSVSTLEMAMQRFSRRVGEASAGTGVLNDVLEANGIAIRDNEGRMRSVEAIFDDYADLLQRAESDQERLTLAVRAFDSEGATMVNMLRNGSQGLADMRQEANDLGVVLEEDLVRAAEDINDKFSILTLQIGTRFKNAVLEAANAVNRLSNQAQNGIDRINEWFESTRSPEDRMRGALGNYEFQSRNGLSTQSPNFFDRSSFNFGGDGEDPPAIVPPGNTRTIREQTDATRALIRELQFELDLVGMSEQEQEIAIAQRRAGADATQEQRAQIASLITARIAETEAIDRQTAAHAANEESMQYLGEMAYDGLMSIARGAESAEEALRGMALQLADAVAQAALFGQGPLSGLFGGGVFNTLFSGAVGMPMQLAEGGKVAGPGTSTSDSIPALLSDGEYVVNARAVSRPGVRQLLDRLNAMDFQLPRFAKGGFASLGDSIAHLSPMSENSPEFVRG